VNAAYLSTTTTTAGPELGSAMPAATSAQATGARATSPAATAVPDKPAARIAVVGCGWWAQGWHLPHLHRHPDAEVVALVEPSATIRSTLNPDVEQLEQLATRYSARPFASLDALLAAGLKVDGVVIAASHNAHYELGRKALAAGWHVFMEKPMTCSAAEAAGLLQQVEATDGKQCFMVNNTANWRENTASAKAWVAAGRIGKVRHVSCAMGSPLTWLFEDAANVGWVRPSGPMLGNGMAWGQLSHSLAWVYYVTGLVPQSVYADMSHSEATGADLYDAAIVRCTNGALISVQGVATISGDKPTSETDARPTGKYIENRIFGTEGSIEYNGIDCEPESGALRLRRHDYNGEVNTGFAFEDGDQGGIGPASLQAFVRRCRGDATRNGCDALIGYRTAATIDAMYRSFQEGQRLAVPTAQEALGHSSNAENGGAKRPRRG